MKLRRNRVLPGVIGIFIGTFTMTSLVFAKPSVAFRSRPLFIKPTSTPTPTFTPTPTVTPSPTLTPTPIPPTPTIKPTVIPTPVPTAKIVSRQDIESWFSHYSGVHSIDVSLLKKIAMCESGANPSSHNGIYGGMFQYSSSTWKSTRIRMNKNPDPSLRFDPEAAIDTAAFTIATRGPAAWPNCH